MNLYHVTITLTSDSVKYDTLRSHSVDAAIDALTHFPDALKIRVLSVRKPAEVAS